MCNRFEIDSLPHIPHDEVIVVLLDNSSGSKLVLSLSFTTTLSSLISMEEKQSVDLMTPSE